MACCCVWIQCEPGLTRAHVAVASPKCSSGVVREVSNQKVKPVAQVVAVADHGGSPRCFVLGHTSVFVWCPPWCWTLLWPSDSHVVLVPRPLALARIDCDAVFALKLQKMHRKRGHFPGTKRDAKFSTHCGCWVFSSFFGPFFGSSFWATVS